MVSRIDNITNIPDIYGKTLNNYSNLKLSEEDRTAAVENYLRNLTVSGQETIPGANIMEYFKLVQNAIWSRQTTEDISEDKRLLVLADDPPMEAEIDSEAITFFLAAREPGQHNQGSPGTNGVRELVYHTRSILQHPEHPSEKLVTMGRNFDNYVVFNLYAHTEYRALARLLWFENVMDSFRWYFRIHRVLSIEQEVRRMGRVDVGELSLAKYSATFFVKTESIYQFGSQELKRVSLSLDV